MAKVGGVVIGIGEFFELAIGVIEDVSYGVGRSAGKRVNDGGEGFSGRAAEGIAGDFSGAPVLGGALSCKGVAGFILVADARRCVGRARLDLLVGALCKFGSFVTVQRIEGDAAGDLLDRIGAGGRAGGIQRRADGGDAVGKARGGIKAIGGAGIEFGRVGAVILAQGFFEAGERIELVEGLVAERIGD